MGGRDSQIVEKDSPPTSFVSAPGPSSLTLQNFSQYNVPQRQPPGGGGGAVGVSRTELAGGARQGYQDPPRRNYPPNNPPQHETMATSTSSSDYHHLRQHYAPHAPAGGRLHDNQLEVGIDGEILAAADDMKMQAGAVSSGGGGWRKGAGDNDDGEVPFDPNLKCPTCETVFRIGQIQLFRQHAAECNNKRK